MTQCKLSASQRDVIYTELSHAVTAAGDTREALFLARLALLLAEEVGNEGRIRAAIADALHGLTPPAS